MRTPVYLISMDRTRWTGERAGGTSLDVGLRGREWQSTSAKVFVGDRVHDEQLDLRGDRADLARNLAVKIALHVHAVHLHDTIAFSQRCAVHTIRYCVQCKRSLLFKTSKAQFMFFQDFCSV